MNLAIDDFGTGYSSLLYLKNYPVDRIKIAREFVSDIATQTNDEAIAATVIAMARTLSMQVIAEGVETEEQAAVLRRLGCPEVQGFLFRPPLLPAQFRAAEADSALIPDPRWTRNPGRRGACRRGWRSRRSLPGQVVADEAGARRASSPAAAISCSKSPDSSVARRGAGPR